MKNAQYLHFKYGIEKGNDNCKEFKMAVKAIKYIQDQKGVNANDAYKLLFNSKWDPIEAAAASST